MRFLKPRPTSLILGALLLLGGCNILGAVLYKVSPPPKTPARYVPVQELAVVFVENYRNPAGSEIDSQQIARLVSDELRNNKVVPLVADNVVNDLRDRDPEAFKKMTIPAIGRAVGAKQVFYVDLKNTTIEVAEGEQMVRGDIEVAVRVVDTQSGLTRWPADAEQGWPIRLQTPFTQPDDKLTEALFRRKLHEGVSARIGHLFYDWYDDDSAAQMGHD